MFAYWCLCLLLLGVGFGVVVLGLLLGVLYCVDWLDLRLFGYVALLFGYMLYGWLAAWQWCCLRLLFWLEFVRCFFGICLAGVVLNGCYLLLFWFSCEFVWISAWWFDSGLHFIDLVGLFVIANSVVCNFASCIVVIIIVGWGSVVYFAMRGCCLVSWMVNGWLDFDCCLCVVMLFVWLVSWLGFACCLYVVRFVLV